MFRTPLIAGIIFGMLAVVIGAFGAHALKPLLAPENAQTFETGVRYQMYHAFALLFCGLLFAHFPSKKLKWATRFFIAGVLLFSGSLYALTALKISGAAGLSGIGILTPIGGVCFIAGWLMLLIAVLSENKKQF